MFGGKVGVPELLVVSFILIFLVVVVAGIWLTRKSNQSNSREISRPSIILAGLGFIWSWLIVALMWQSPLLSGYTFGGLFTISVGSLLLAFCVFLFGRHKKDWNVFARWLIWSMFVVSFVVANSDAERTQRAHQYQDSQGKLN
jgi:hypothetical protein